MSAAATIPFSQPKAAPWSPSDRDRLIFQWVKFEGQTQSWVASELEISQSTVSRIVERYERWIARGGPAQQGALNHDERLRTQRWLTYERNEWMLASALRLAGEMERALDTSKSTVSRPISKPSAESEVRTEHRTIDRSGLACRYLRLAYRINMDQLKLVEQDPLPALEPLTTDDLGDNAYPADPHELLGNKSHTEPQRSQTDDLHDDDAPLEGPLRASVPLCEPTAPQLKTENRKLQTVAVVELSPDSPPLHALHNPACPESPLTTDHNSTFVECRSPQKPLPPAYAGVIESPERAADESTDDRLRSPSSHQFTKHDP